MGLELLHLPWQSLLLLQDASASASRDAHLERLMESPGFSTFLILSLATWVAIVSIVGGFWYRYKKNELEASLKHALVERGMSAEEIKTIIEASKDGSAARRCVDAFTARRKTDKA